MYFWTRIKIMCITNENKTILVFKHSKSPTQLKKLEVLQNVFAYTSMLIFPSKRTAHLHNNKFAKSLQKFNDI